MNEQMNRIKRMMRNLSDNGKYKVDIGVPSLGESTIVTLTAPTAKAVGFRRKAKPSFWCRFDSVRCCGCRECHCISCVRG